jgi:hypothetical protein
VRVGHATKRGEALVVQTAKRDTEVTDELRLHQHDISIRHLSNPILLIIALPPHLSFTAQR